MIIALPIIAATIVFVVVPMLAGESWSLETLLAVAYPILDVIVLTALIRLSVGGGHRNRSLGLLTASVSISLLADLLYNGLAAQGLVEDMPGWMQACYTLSVILMTAAALSSDAPPRCSSPTPTTPAPHVPRPTHRVRPRIGRAPAAPGPRRRHRQHDQRPDPGRVRRRREPAHPVARTHPAQAGGGAATRAGRARPHRRPDRAAEPALVGLQLDRTASWSRARTSG